MENYQDNNGNIFPGEKMLPCPFCGFQPNIIFIGNDYSKKRFVQIKCSNATCRATIQTGGIQSDSKTVAGYSIKVWNSRANESQQQEIEGLREKYEASLIRNHEKLETLRTYIGELKKELSRIREGVGKMHEYSFSDAPDLSYPLSYYLKKDIDNLIGKGE